MLWKKFSDILLKPLQIFCWSRSIYVFHLGTSLQRESITLYFISSTCSASALLRSNDDDNLNSFLYKHKGLTQYFHEIRQVFENTKWKKFRKFRNTSFLTFLKCSPTSECFLTGQQNSSIRIYKFYTWCRFNAYKTTNEGSFILYLHATCTTSVLQIVHRGQLYNLILFFIFTWGDLINYNLVYGNRDKDI